MKAVLISIQPKWVGKMASGEKTIEVRKTQPNFEIPFKCYIYETKKQIQTTDINGKILHQQVAGQGKIIGEFICDKIYEYSFNWGAFTAWGIKLYQGIERDKKKMCLTNKDIENYACKNGHAEKLYGWHISNLKIYDKPKELSEFKNLQGVQIKRPFQSWGYVEELTE